MAIGVATARVPAANATRDNRNKTGAKLAAARVQRVVNDVAVSISSLHERRIQQTHKQPPSHLALFTFTDLACTLACNPYTLQWLHAMEWKRIKFCMQMGVGGLHANFKQRAACIVRTVAQYYAACTVRNLPELACKSVQLPRNFIVQ